MCGVYQPAQNPTWFWVPPLQRTCILWDIRFSVNSAQSTDLEKIIIINRHGGKNENMKKRGKPRAAFTLIEAVISIAVFAILLISIISLSQQIQKIGQLSSFKVTAATIAAEQMEVIRNMSYDAIGTENTYPVGTLPASQTVKRNGGTFTVSIVMNYVDDPADGLLPADTVPADYKQVEVKVCWDASSCTKPVRLTSNFVPKTLEYASDAGAMFVTVIDASGLPVAGADVRVTNDNPAVNVYNQTDIHGKLELLNLPPAQNTYHVQVSKPGYSSDQTIAVSASNPNPTNPDTSIVTSDVTNVTLAIDRVSSLLVRALNQDGCTGLGQVSVRVKGSRLIGQSPDVPAYDQTFATDASGQFLISNLPWDSYSMTISGAGYDVVGITPPDTITINPGASVTASVVMTGHQANTARIIVRDVGTHAPIANAAVTLSDGASYSPTQMTDQGTIQQTNWIGGAGQSTIGDPTKYAARTDGIDTTVPNQISLADSPQTKTATEDFTSTTAEDSSTTAAWSTSPPQLTLPFDPLVPDQYSPSAQGQSKKLNVDDGRITDVTLTATADPAGQTITYWAAADGVTFEQVTPGEVHAFAATGNDLRWRVVMSTTDVHATPIVTGLSLSYTIRIRSITSGNLVSSTFDNGGPTNLTTLSWEPGTQPLTAGPDALGIQVATSDPIIGNGSPTIMAAADPSINPLFSKNIGDASSTLFLAQSFTSTVDDSITQLDLKIAKHNSPTSTVTAYIYSDAAGQPGLNLSGSGQDISTSIPDDGPGWADSWRSQIFAPNTAILNGTKYWIVLAVSGANSSKYWTVLRSQTDTTYSGGTALVGDTLGTMAPLCVGGCDMAFQLTTSGQSVTPTTPSDFVGPDGTATSYYTVSGGTLRAAASNHRYFRYKVFLHTDDPAATPMMSRLTVIKNNACTPPGQTLFTPVPTAGPYSLLVDIAGYSPYVSPLEISGNVTQFVDLTPSP